MLVKGDMKKLLYTELYYAERRLRTLHCIYSETKDMRVLRKVQLAKQEVQRIAKRIEAAESLLTGR